MQYLQQNNNIYAKRYHLNIPFSSHKHLQFVNYLVMILVVSNIFYIIVKITIKENVLQFY